MIDDILTLTQVAELYLKDGAPATAADRLREAADMCDELAKHRDTALRKVIGK